MPVQTRKRTRKEESRQNTTSAPPPKRAKVTKSVMADSSEVATTAEGTATLAAIAEPTGPTMRVAYLLRAVNVSGSNPCNMKRLVQLVTAELGWINVKTYLQSGNLVADVPSSLSMIDSSEALRQLLANKLNVHCAVMSRTLSEVDTLIQNCPYDTLDLTKVHGFFLDSAATQAGLDKLEQKPKGDDGYTWDGGNHLYLHYPNGAGRAKLNGMVLEKALGVQGTGRNWRSVLAVRDLLN